MKKLLILVIIALFLLSGCSQAPEETDVPVTAEPEAPAASTEKPTTVPAASTSATVPAASTPSGAVDVKVTEPTKKMDSRVEKVLNKVDSIKSYEYYYQTSDNWDLIRDKYYIKDNKIKINLFEVNYYNKKHYFDTVYLDTNAESAVAYCEEPGHSRCSDSDKEFVVSYSDFIIKTPEEWVKEIDYAEWAGTEQLDQRAADILEYENDDGTTTRMWVDSFSGLARQIWIYRGDTENIVEKYGFRDLAINSVRTSDMEHQFQ